MNNQHHIGSKLLLFGFLVLPSVMAMAANPALHYAAPRCGYSNQMIVAYKDGGAYNPIDSTTASNTSNFLVQDSTTGSYSTKTISSATYYASERATLLTLSSGMTNLHSYVVTAAGVEDSLGNTLPSTTDIVYYSTTQTAIVGGLWDSSDSLSGTPTLGLASYVYEDLSEEASGGLFAGLLGLLEALTCSLLTCADTKMSARWTGFIVPSSTGTYTIEADYNELARVWLDEPRNGSSSILIDQWTATLTSSNPDRTATNTIALTAGEYYPVTVEWAHRGNKDDTGRIVLNWTPPSSSKVNVPAANFRTCVGGSFLPDVESFTIGVPALASACGSATVTVKAVSTGFDPLTSYAGTITLSTASGHGDWSSSGAGVFDNGTANDGIATYTFAAGDNGEVTFSLTNRHADVTAVSVTDSSVGVTSTSSNITFQHNGIEINQASPHGWDVVAGRDHDFEVEYLVLDTGNTECQTANFTGSVNFQFWRGVSALNPAGAAAPTINGATVGTSEGAAASVNLTVTNGVAPFTLVTTDVGDFQLNVKDTSSGFMLDSGGSPVALTGLQTKGSDITVRPFGLYVAATGNPYPLAVDEIGTVYKKAGESFGITVRGVAYELADDSNSDGLPDGHNDSDPTTGVDLSNNSVLASYDGNGSGETLTLVPNIVQPSPGNDGTLNGSLGAFSGGAASGSAFTYSDVGIIEITAQSDSSYLNSGVQLMGKSSYVGRFIPDHFSVADSSIIPSLTVGWLDNNGDDINEWTCDMAYLGQNFGFTSDPELIITALDASGNVTQNYKGAFNKFTGAAGTLVDVGKPVSSGAVLSVPAVSVTVDDDEADGFDDPGVFRLIVGGYEDIPYPMSYSKPIDPSNELPFDAEFHLDFSVANLTDADSVCYKPAAICETFSTSAIAGTTMYFGRLVLDDNFGSWADDLVLSYRVEAWQTIAGTNVFATLADDGAAACSGTGANAMTVTMGNYTGGLADGETTATVASTTNGLGSITLTAPGPSNSGSVDLSINVVDFLQYNYVNTGASAGVIDAEDEPTATATFGVSSGKKFFRREVNN